MCYEIFEHCLALRKRLVLAKEKSIYNAKQKLKQCRDKTAMTESFFVFYTMGQGPVADHANWSFPNFPYAWWATGSGNTSAVGKPVLEYEREMQFTGPDESRHNMKSLIDNHFKQMVAAGSIAIYKICDHFTPDEYSY